MYFVKMLAYESSLFKEKKWVCTTLTLFQWLILFQVESKGIGGSPNLIC